MNNLSNKDKAFVNCAARRYMIDGEDTYLIQVREFMAIATASERKAIRFWWGEGVRDYAKDMDEYYEVMEMIE
jgi:hypothetical protein